MDELELLKKDWQKEDTNYPKLSINEIYSLLQKKSSSLVKWLFYISVAELVFWILINTIPYFNSEEYRARLDAIYGHESLFIGLTIFSYAIILIFIYLLYKSYKSITTTDNAKKLMESILKTRKIVKYYVIYNLAMVVLSTIITLSFYNNPESPLKIAEFNTSQTLTFFFIMIVLIGVLLLFIWLFYRIIYGILLSRLNKNYKELKKLEV